MKSPFLLLGCLGAFIVRALTAAPASLSPDLARQQDTFPRVHEARLARGAYLRALFKRKGMSYPPREIFLRAFKRERVLELWARSDGRDIFRLVKKYPICALSGHLGPKRQEADEQIPEGFYYVTDFNPTSQFHLSLRVSYPNGVDQVRGHREHLRHLGGDIFIHGGCETVGCLPLTDAGIDELYLVVVDTFAGGAPSLPLHIFPLRLSDRRFRSLNSSHGPPPKLLAFWRNLKQGYDYFERNRRPPLVATGLDGRYWFY